MKPRSLDVLRETVHEAQSSKDVNTLYACAAELDELGTEEASALALYAQGAAAFCTGSYPSALEKYGKALEIYEGSGDTGGVAMITTGLGLISKATGNYPEALQCYQRAMEAYRELGDMRGVAGSIGRIGSVQYYTHDYHDALKSTEEARAIYRSIGDLAGVAKLSVSIVFILVKLEEYDAASSLLATVDTLNIDAPQTMIEREQTRAMIQAHAGDYEEAKDTLRGAVQLAREHQLPSWEAEVHLQGRELCKEAGDFKGYVRHNEEHARISNEINGNETAAKLAMMESQQRLEAERKEFEKHLAVLYSTLPRTVADRVARGEAVNDTYAYAAVLFLDIVGFTSHSSALDASAVINVLQKVFTTLDAICERHGVTKVKTIGDAYLAVAFSESGERRAEAGKHGIRVARAALEMIASDLTWPDGRPMLFRIGMHSGPIVAGVIGTQRLQYDVWGDTVNVASRMESTGEPGRIHVSEVYANSLIPGTWTLVPRGDTAVKGKGLMPTYWLER